LLKLYASAVEEEAAPPPGFPPRAQVTAALREAATPALPPAWLAYFEYFAAWDARNGGNLDEIRQAGDHLEELARRLPQLTHYRQERALLLADMRRALGEFARALAEVDALADAFPATGAERLLSNAVGLRGEILRETGRLDEAAAATRRSLQLAVASGNTAAIERAVLRDLELAQVTGRYAASIETIAARLASLSSADPERGSLLVFRGYAESGLAGVDAEGLQRARTTLAEARPLVHGHLRTRADLKRLDLALRAGDVAGASAAAADCEADLGPALTADPLPRDAGELLGHTARLLLLRRADARALRAFAPRLHAAIGELGREWQNQPPRLGGIGFLHLGQRRDLLGSGIALELALARAEGRDDGAERAAQVLLDLQAHTSLARARRAAACTVAEVRRTLLPGAGALLYLPTRAVTHAFLLLGDRTLYEELPGELESDDELQALLGLLLRAPGIAGEERANVVAAIDRSSRTASGLLLPRELGRLVPELTALTVVGADLLGGVPLEAMQLADGRLLGEVVPIDHTASLPLTVAQAAAARPTPPANSSLLVLACTAPAAGLPEAAGIQGFAFQRSDLEPAFAEYAHPLVHCDAAVTRREVLDADLLRFDVVQVVAHGVRGADERGGGLLVADGVVRRSELDGHAARGVVVVSACSGGEGPGRAGEGDAFTSIAGAFLWNGAQAVIASRHTLLALDHFELLALCHAGLAHGDSPARALQSARRRQAAGSDLLSRGQRALVQVTGAGQLPVIAR